MPLYYHWKRLRRSWNISLKGWHLTFGFWVNLVIDRVVRDSSVAAKVCISVYHFQLIA